MLCPACSAENIDGARFCAKCGALLPTDAPAPEVDPLIGQTVGGRYTIVKVLGEGGMGRVYEAERHIAGVVQRVAVKTLHAHLSSDAAVVARFHRECGTLAQLRHPNTIKVEDFGQTADGTLYIAMEFVDGISVGDEILKHGAMPAERVERIMGQVCGSLSEAHKQGVIHRDLKPDNVVITNVGDDVDFVKLLDFGIAARKDSTDAAKEAKLTQQGMVLGTPPYMSPEQFMGKELDARSDIYSLGVMVYEMLTTRLPFEANTPWEWATCHMTAQPHPFEDQVAANADIPFKMKEAVLRALAKKPEDRPGTVREFFEDLSGGFADMSTTGARPSHYNSNAGRSPSTAAMAPHGGPSTGAGPAAKGPQTEIGGIPSMDALAPPNFGGGSSPNMTPEAMAYPPPQAMQPMQPIDQGGGGGNRTPLLIGAAVASIVVVGAVGLLVHNLTKGQGGTLDVPSGAPATVTIPTASASVATVATVKTVPTATVVTGDAACEDAIKRANGQDIAGAASADSRCTGGQKSAVAAAIKNNTFNAAKREAFDGKCSQARNTANIGQRYGASVNVDSSFPTCRGK